MLRLLCWVLVTTQCMSIYCAENKPLLHNSSYQKIGKKKIIKKHASNKKNSNKHESVTLAQLDKKIDDVVFANSNDKQAQNWSQLVRAVKFMQAYDCECPSCGAFFDTQDQAVSCYARHWDAKLFNCPSCLFSARSKADLDTHFKKEHLHLLPQLSCDDKLLTSQELIKQGVGLHDIHVTNIERDLKAILCCKMVLCSWSVALNHFALHHRTGERLYACNNRACLDKHYSSRQALECYLRAVNSTIFQCVFCQQEYNTREQLVTGHLLTGCKAQSVLNQQDNDIA